MSRKTRYLAFPLGGRCLFCRRQKKTDEGLSGSMWVYSVYQPSLCKRGWFRKAKPGGLSQHLLYIIYTLYSTQQSIPVLSFKQETPGNRERKFWKRKQGTHGGGISGWIISHKETHGTEFLRICRKRSVVLVEKGKIYSQPRNTRSGYMAVLSRNTRNRVPKTVFVKIDEKNLKKS